MLFILHVKGEYPDVIDGETKISDVINGAEVEIGSPIKISGTEEPLRKWLLTTGWD